MASVWMVMPQAYPENGPIVYRRPHAAIANLACFVEHKAHTKPVVRINPFLPVKTRILPGEALR
jgi:hypothetical protein